jgi:heme oxygenase
MTQISDDPWSVALREAVRPVHALLDRAPIVPRLLAGTASRPAYAATMPWLHGLHALLARALAGDPRLDGAFGHPRGRAQAAARDLAVLGVAPLACGQGPLAMVEAGLADPCARYGIAWVIEGSRAGSRLLTRPLARILGRPGPATGIGMDYHLLMAESGDAAAIRQRLAAMPWSGDGVAAAAAAAAGLMRALVPVFKAIDPDRADA